ncbi:TolC family protein [Noviherbaspirillum cavernae]|uniref:TolC family protein n=1 Tax=Noviherbaspirillum cavernae TaxID=2320862 RepID=A0A418X5S2_9BURK|nr:TolC family protein [Noviherbaspirillum cavernae]RJG07834.1 TolC family protein [Noviherbaspirillum cavernae]
MVQIIETPLHADHRLRRLYQCGVLAALIFSGNTTHAQSRGLTLESALQLSLQHSALTKAADASVQASREMVAKSGQLPDPMLKVGIDNLPVNGPDRYSVDRDFMTMRRIGVEQQWVSSDKRAARTERAQRVVDVEEGNYLTNVAKVREETAMAWINTLYAQRGLALYKALESETSQDLLAAQAAYRGAKAAAVDVGQAQLVLSQTQDRIRKGEQALKSARIGLSRWTTVPVESVAAAMPPLVSHLARLPAEELEKIHPTLLTARRAVALADSDAAVATRERRPDWTFEAAFSQRGSQYSNMVSVGVSIPLPVNPSQRQDRDIAEKSALATKARLQYEDAMRELQTDIQEQSSTLDSLNQRVSQLTTELLPQANQQVELATAAYRAGTGNLSAVFNAKKAALEMQLQILDVEKEAALMWTKLEYHVIPHDFIRRAAP